MKKSCKIPREHRTLGATQPKKWPPVCHFPAQKRGGYHRPWSHCSAIFQQEEHAADKLNGRQGGLTKFKAAGAMPTSNFNFGLRECHSPRSQVSSCAVLNSHHFSTALSKLLILNFCQAKRNQVRSFRSKQRTRLLKIKLRNLVTSFSQRNV